MSHNVIALRDMRAEKARLAVLSQIQAMKKMTVAEARVGRNFVTDDAKTSAITITVSAREAFSLVRVLGPIGLQNGDGSFTRLFAAMATCQTHLMRAPDGKSPSVVAALQVLQVAINDHMWNCRNVPHPPKRAPARRLRPGRAFGDS